MTNISEFKTYKKAKIVLKDLQRINDILQLTTKGIETHSKYIPVRSILQCIKENKQILDIYIRKYGDIVKNKGHIK